MGDWDLADLMGGPDLGSAASIRRNYRRLLEVCPMVSESVSSSFVDLLSLAIHWVQAMSHVSIPAVHICAIDSTLSSNIGLI